MQARDRVELQAERLYGAFKGTIVRALSTGDFEVQVDNVAHGPMVAQVAHLAGGTDSVAGIRIMHQVGARCLVVFEQGDVRSPKIIGFLDSKQTAGIGMQAGDISFATPGGVTLSLDESLASARLFQTDGYGMFASKADLRLTHRLYSLQATMDYTRQKFNGNATHFYSSDGQVVHTMQKHSVVDTEHSHLSTTRTDKVTGNWVLDSGNNIKMRASQLNGVASEEINFTARNDFAIMSKTFSSTQNSDIFFGSNLGNIQLAALAGDVELAAGAVATAEVGITAYTAKISASVLGIVEIDNHTTNTTWSVEGRITEDAKLGKSETYGLLGLDSSSTGPVSIASKLTNTMSAGAGPAAAKIEITPASITIQLNQATVIKLLPGVIDITAPIVKINGQLVVQGDISWADGAYPSLSAHIHQANAPFTPTTPPIPGT